MWFHTWFVVLWVHPHHVLCISCVSVWAGHRAVSLPKVEQCVWPADPGGEGRPAATQQLGGEALLPQIHLLCQRVVRKHCCECFLQQYGRNIIYMNNLNDVLMSANQTCETFAVITVFSCFMECKLQLLLAPLSPPGEQTAELHPPSFNTFYFPSFHQPYKGWVEKAKVQRATGEFILSHYELMKYQMKLLKCVKSGH